MTLQESGVRLFADGTTGFLRDMGKATKSVDAFGQTGGGVSKIIGGLGGVAGTAAKVIGGVFVAGVGAAAAGIGLAVKETISLESAFAGVIKTTDGLTGTTGELTAEGETLLQGFRDMAKDVPIAVEELMGIGELGGQLGIAREDLLEFTATIAAMGEATNLTTEEAAVGFAQLANIMGTPTDQISNMGSSVVALGNNMATTERDIFSFAQRIAGAGEIAGLTESDVFGISAAFASVGIEAAAGGTAVQKVLLGMNEAVISGGAELETFAATAGMSVDEFAEAWETDAAGAFESFVSGLGEAGDDAMGILSDLGLEDQRLIKAFLSLAQASGKTDDEISLLAESLGISAEAFAENTALMTEAEARYATTESQIQTFKNSLRDIGFTIGSFVMPMFNELLAALRPLIAGFGFLMEGDIAGFLEGVSFAASDLASMFGATDEQAAAVSEFVTQVVEWFTVNIPQALSELSATWAETWPKIQETIGLVKEKFIETWNAISETVTTVISDLTPIFEEVFGFIEEIVGNVLENMSLWWEENGNTVTAVALTLWEVLQAIFSSIATVIGPIWETFVGNVKLGFESMAPLIDSFKILWEALAPVVMGLLAVLGAAFLAFIGVVLGVFSGIADAVAPFLVTVGMIVDNVIGIFTGLADFITGFVELVVALWEGNTDATETAWKKLGDSVKTIVGNLVEGIVTLFVGLGVTIKTFLSGFIDGIIEFFANLYNELVGNSIVVDLVDDIVALFADMISNVLQSISDFASDIISDFIEISTGILDTVITLVDNILSTLKESVTNFTNIGGEMMDGIISGITSKAGALITAIKSAITAAIDSAKSALGIASPSKFTALVLGQPISQGVAAGIVEDANMISESLVGSIKKSVGVAVDAVDSFWKIGASMAATGNDNVSDSRFMDSELRNSIMPAAVSPVSSAGQIVNNISNSNDVVINFEGNYASQPAIKDSNDLAFALGLAGT